jgi:hypothetical protein
MDQLRLHFLFMAAIRAILRFDHFRVAFAIFLRSIDFLFCSKLCKITENYP